jgi:hypothetical protein
MTIFTYAVAAGVLLLLGVAGIILFVRWGTRWGATPGECLAEMTGDAYLDSGPAVRTVMTRAITIEATAETVWPWLAQLGRGAGWYSVDLLDNFGHTSAHHIVSWIPPPALGDASAIGYLRHLESGRELVWWAGEVQFFGAFTRLVVDILLKDEGERSRLVTRMSADAAGATGTIAITVFQLIDTIMARRQLLGIKERAERHGARCADPDSLETGLTDQYQRYETIYASGQTAGVRGKELASHWRKEAIKDNVLEDVLHTP